MIVAKGCSTPAGLAGQVRPRGAMFLCAEVAQASRPPESEHPGTEINHSSYSNKVYEKSL
ncbi:hypothetical protein FBF83_01395 [Pseudalkalibacillus hwajinpoensis]|uniref:Uncharacterized protein n=1 Tax=Guptibacillus hwajinpoensis TaxID=208199 RepID=A0A4U1MK30_9BACL|nr:hypothetical protein FBF83_01395 [Pseudalkalibacillus hwajinpoensis]